MSTAWARVTTTTSAPFWSLAMRSRLRRCLALRLVEELIDVNSGDAPSLGDALG
jgi:hypothetical protein